MSERKLIRRPREGKSPFAEEETLQDVIDRQLRQYAGAQRFENRDPLYELGETFSTSFDFVGRQAAAAAYGMEMSEARGTDMRNRISLQATDGSFARRFSEHAFRNGALAGGILQGEGKTILFSCLRRSAGYVETTVDENMRNLDKSANDWPLKQSPSRMLVNDGELYGAVALVVKSTRQAAKVLNDLKKAALQLEGMDTSTLREVYPFLFDKEEKELLQRLRQKRRDMQLAGDTNSQAYRAVCRGISKCGGQIHRKRQMTHAFLNKLDQLRSNALTTAALFEQPNFLKEAVQQFQEEILQDDDQNEGGNERER